MKLKELKEFLLKFDIAESKIEEFIENKQIIEVEGNLYLTSEKFKKNQYSGNGLIFIQLKSLLPSKYLIKFILKNTENIAEIKSEKQAMNFTYSKNLSFESIASNTRFIKGKYYLIKYKNQVLGYVEKDISDKKHPLKNNFNIGNYLKEI